MTVVLWYLQGIGSRSTQDTKIWGMYKSLVKNDVVNLTLHTDQNLISVG